jgi:hypothetical protein
MLYLIFFALNGASIVPEESEDHQTH